MDYKYIYVLDYNTDNAYKIELNELDKQIKDVEVILNSRGLNIDECAYMCTNSELEFETIDLI